MLFQIDIAASLRWVKGQTACLSRSHEHIAAVQHDACVAGSLGRAHLVEELENLDRQAATDAGTVLEARRGECALGRAGGEFARDFGEAREGLGQKEAVV